jgi:hypothetical protein
MMEICCITKSYGDKNYVSTELGGFFLKSGRVRILICDPIPDFDDTIFFAQYR